MKSVIEREYRTSVRGFTFLSLSSKANQLEDTLFASNTHYLDRVYILKVSFCKIQYPYMRKSFNKELDSRNFRK